MDAIGGSKKRLLFLVAVYISISTLLVVLGYRTWIYKESPESGSDSLIGTEQQTDTPLNNSFQSRSDENAVPAATK